MSTNPVASTPGHCDEHAAAIDQAAAWLAMAPLSQKPSPIVPELRRRFNLTILEAMTAIREAAAIKATRR